MAIGTAKILGYDIMENFKQPFRSSSIAEFWRRWHIALQSWFRDYLYLSLGGNRVTRIRWYCNIMVVFVLSGLWHGASWTFIIWGSLHGIFMCVGTAVKEVRGKIADIIFGPSGRVPALAVIGGGFAVMILGYFIPLRWYGPDPHHLVYLEQIALIAAGLVMTALGFFKGFRGQGLPSFRKTASIFLIYNLVAVSFTFFRAARAADAWYAITHMFQSKQVLKLSQWFVGDFRKYEFAIIVLMIITLGILDTVQGRGELRKSFARLSWPLRWFLYTFIVVGILVFGSLSQSKFIYFNF